MVVDSSEAMSGVPSKHSRDKAQDLEGLLNNLQDWELSFKEKDKKLKSESLGKEKYDLPTERRREGNSSQFSSTSAHAGSYTSAAEKYAHLRNYDKITQLSSGLMTEENLVDANTEKELGNEYFKNKKFNEAIDCYSRSIALSPTAVAYANRAMAYLKIKRFQEAENDCTEALNLDDRYIKAYSRRSTARKELGKLKESLEDADFALRLEPQNQEIKKQQAEVKSLLQKEILKMASVTSKSSITGEKPVGKSKVGTNKSANGVQSASINSQREMVSEILDDRTKVKNSDVPLRSMQVDARDMKIKGQAGNALHGHTVHGSGLETTKRINTSGKQDLNPSVQELAARAASLAKAEAAKNISPPNSAYQFEVSWRGLSGDHNLQVKLLKATSPDTLPQIFKNALSASILMDIIQCIRTFFFEDVDLAIRYLENLTKIPRFDMIIMCLSSSDKAELTSIWNEFFSKTDPKHTEMISNLQPRFRIQQR